MMKKLLYLFIPMLLFSCNKQETTQEEVSIPSTPQALPAKSQEELVALFQAADDVDIMLLEVGASMSAQGNGAKQQVTYISPQGVERIPCREICHFFIKSQGEIIAHTGAFLGNDCSYYIFYENDQAKYINGMTQKGIDFINMIQSGVKTKPNN